MTGRLRRITVYETSTRFYIVGCDLSGTRYNVLKIDRLDAKALITGEPEHSYSKSDIMELLATVTEGNSIVHRGKKANVTGGLIERVSNAYGILGVVRFTEGFYLLVITKANVVASFGYHSIYKVAEVATISIGVDGLLPNSAEEQRYLRIFQSVDLSTDFYFSYTYDLSRSLQENCLAADWNKDGLRTLNSDSRFVWNDYLLHPLRSNLTGERWMIELIHGFVGQQVIDMPTCKLSLVLIGRRSAKYAGTRFLKRGANLFGDVANDVETEQLLWDTSSSPCFLRGRFSSFVQRRGSVPLRWSQDPTTRGVVGKPLILIDIHEPHAQTAAAHFRHLRNKYGNPIVVYNLVKRREKRRHEVLLHERFGKAIEYLNQFLEPDEHIAYVAFDVARCNKNKEMNVLAELDEVAMRAVVQHGWFQTFDLPSRLKFNPRTPLLDFNPHHSACGRFLVQRGISRANCVDCLDRTNVAQFAIGKAALACQLVSLGVLNNPHVELSGEVFEELFDSHGDTMAWQYAGSQLVHSVKTYKKTAALQERGRDVIQTLSRYYSNTFADYDKQNAINLFLGMYRPGISCRSPLWELSSDYYLHFPTGTRITTDYCAWMYETDELEKVLKDFVIVEEATEAERAIEDSERNADAVTPEVEDGDLVVVSEPVSSTTYAHYEVSSADDFREYYRTFELTTLEPRVKHMQSLEAKKITVSDINELPPSGTFALWKKDVKAEKKSKDKKKANDTDDDEDDVAEECEQEEDPPVIPARAFERLCPPLPTNNRKIVGQNRELASDVPVLMTGLVSRAKAYGVHRLGPNQVDSTFYQQYVNSGGMPVDEKEWNQFKPTLLIDLSLPEVPTRRFTSLFTMDSALQVEVPEVSLSSLKFYTQSSVIPDRPRSKRDATVFSTYGRA